MRERFDVGCGPGLLLIGAAKHLTTGRAVGVDIWKDRVETRNRPDVALENAQIEGVADRVEVKDCDARQLPFEDSSFDVVLARTVLNYIDKKDERKKALLEMLRVLKPGGQLGLLS
jgi:ubiquinone/menaquinone biosynthesis C-methylase UbiE